MQTQQNNGAISSPEQKTIQQFIAEHGITMTAEQLSTRTDRTADEFSKEAGHYLCTLKANGRAMSVPYSVGSGIVLRYVSELVAAGKRIPELRESKADILKICSLYSKPKTAWHAGIYEHCLAYGRKHYRPDLSDVLNCLGSDYSGYSNSRNFEDWCAEYGYDADSRKAEAIYDQVREQSRNLESLLTRKACEELAFAVERL